MASPKYKVLVGGTEIDDFVSLDFASSLDLNVQPATITFPDFETLNGVSGIGKDIQIQRDNKIIWRGLGTSYQKMYDYTGAKQYNLICKDSKIYLGRELFSKNNDYYAVYGSTYMLSDTQLYDCQSLTKIVDNPGNLFTAMGANYGTTDNFDTTLPGVLCVAGSLVSPPANTTYCLGIDFGSAGTDFTYSGSLPNVSQRIRFGIGMYPAGLTTYGVLLIDVNYSYRKYQIAIPPSNENSSNVIPGRWIIPEIDIDNYTEVVGQFDPTKVRYYAFYFTTPASPSSQYTLYFDDARLRSYQYCYGASDVFQDILNSQYSAILTAGLLPSTKIRVLTSFNNFFSLQALQQIIQTTALETRFNTDLTVDLESQVGSDLSSSIVFETSLNASQTEWDYSLDNVINNVIVAGSSTNSNQVNVKSSDSTSITANGRWSKIFNFPNVYDSALLQAYANAALNDLLNPTDTYKATLWDNYQGVAFQIGDKVTIEDDVVGDDAAYRIFSLKRHYDSMNAEVVQGVFIKNMRQITVNNWKVNQLQYTLNNWNNGLQTVANNVTTGAPVTTPANPQTGTYSNTIPSNSGKLEEIQTSLVVQDQSGELNQVEIDLTPSGSSITTETMYLVDWTTNTLLDSWSSWTSGTKYIYTTNSDILGHNIGVHVRAENASGSNKTITLDWTVTVTMNAVS